MIGVLVIIQPGGAEFQKENLLVIGAALSYALFQIWTRRLKADGSLSAMVHSAASLLFCCWGADGGGECDLAGAANRQCHA